MTEIASLAWRQYRLEQRLFWRNPSAAFFNFLLPLLFLVFFGAILHGNRHDIDVIVPGIAGMAVMATTFTALAYNMTFLREQGVLKRFHGTPMPGISYLGGLAGSAVTNAAIQIVIIVFAGRIFFGTGWPRDWFELFVFVAVGVVCFASLGVAFSHVIPNFDSTPAYVNAVFLPVILISGVFYDAAHDPSFIRDIAQALPLDHLINGLSGAMVKGTSIGTNITALVVLAAWAAVGIVFAVRGFRWEQRRN